MKKIIITALTLLILTSCTTKTTPLPQSKIKINNTTINTEIATTQEEQAKGLGGKIKLGENDGMLFVYKNKENLTFWMKDMNFPIDIIWIADNKIVDISPNTPLFTNNKITTIQTNQPTNQVLEVNAGFADKHKIKIGDQIEILKNNYN
jgi:uncharacterized membrane protein (UPF0127 family)